jgi:hypothetical protein
MMVVQCLQTTKITGRAAGMFGQMVIIITQKFLNMYKSNLANQPGKEYKMKPTKEIAKAHNLSPNSVKKWSTAKRERASRLIDMQINPVIMQLTGELYALCFATSNMSNKLFANVYTNDGCGHFSVMTLDNESSWFIPTTDLTVENLQSAIAQIEGIIYA